MAKLVRYHVWFNLYEVLGKMWYSFFYNTLSATRNSP